MQEKVHIYGRAPDDRYQVSDDNIKELTSHCQWQIPCLFPVREQNTSLSYSILALSSHLTQNVGENATVAEVLKFYIGVQSDQCFKSVRSIPAF